MKWCLHTVIYALATLSCVISCQPFFSANMKESVTVSDRISNPSVTSFCADTLGRMWIGTQRGLNRFNGYDFHQYFFSSDTTGLPGNSISDLAMDIHGRLWVGTEDGVAMVSGDGSFHRVPVNSKEKYVYQILCSEDGHVFLNMMEDLCVLDESACSFESRLSTIDRYHSYCQKCYLDGKGNLWSVASLEIRCYDTATLANTENYMTPHFVVTSALLSGGEIWISGRHSLSIFNTVTRRYEDIPKAISSCNPLMREDIEFIAEADSSNIFLKTADGQLYRYNKEEESVAQVSSAQLQIPSDFAVKGIFPDREGRLWLASDNNGFVVRPPLGEGTRLGLSTGELDSASIVSASRDSHGNIWMFSLHDGLFRFETESGKLLKVDVSHTPAYDKADYLHSNNPLVLADSSGCVWMSFPDSRSIMKGRLHSGKMKVEEEYGLYYPRVAVCDSEGGVWIGTFNYYIHHQPAGGKQMRRIQVYPAKTTQITCLLEYGDHIIVGAYNEPLMMVNRHTYTMEYLPVSSEDYEKCTPRGFFCPTVLRLDSNGDILIGTRFNGLLRYNPGSSSLQKIAGFPETDIASIEEDAFGRLWVSTTDGIVVYSPSEDSWYDYYSSGISSGMYFYDRSSLGGEDGYMLFGTSHGLVVINPGESHPASDAKVYFEDIKLGNKAVALDGRTTLALSHRNNSFGVTFAVPDYLGVGTIRYRYKLEGNGHSWVELGSGREIYFSNLPAGKYSLRVCHYLGNENLSENVLNIKIAPHPLLSLPALVSYLVILILLILLVRKAQQRIMKEKSMAMEAEFEKEQEKKNNRMNMTFFSNVSHEFRTPLTMISGPVSQLSEERGLSDHGKYLLSLVKSSVERMLSLVNQLLDFSRLENASLDLKVQYGDIVPFLAESMRIFKANAESLGIRIIEEGLEYPLVTWFDPDIIQKILSNLMSNALKFTPKGGIIVLELDEQVNDDEQYIRISVSDNGKGIPEDKFEAIFDRYYQLRNSGNSRQGNTGTGIGLYYARSLANIHHGSLTASNREGGGAEFSLILPKSEWAYSQNEKTVVETTPDGRFLQESVPSLTAGDPDPENDQRPLILAVDDDPDIIRYLISLFSGQYRVTTANSAEEGYTLALESSPDLILSDVAMPGKDGFEFCREIKQDLQLCHIPVILVTAMGAMENQVLGLNEGADAYVTKPFDVSYLWALVRSQLENRRRVQKLVNAATGSASIDSLNSKDKSFLDMLYTLMEEELSNEDMDVARLASLLRISRTKFYYKMKGLTGKSPSEFFMQYKLNMAAKMLVEGKLNVSEVAIKTGFASLAHFSKSFKKQFGVSPSKYNL